MLKFCWDGDGSELGSMKNEADDEVKAVFKKKYGEDWLEKYNHQEELDGGDFHWDDFIGGGCKQYALRKTCFDGSVVEICKLKGFKKDKNNKWLSFDAPKMEVRKTIRKQPRASKAA